MANGLREIPLISVPKPVDLLDGQHERINRLFECAHGRIPVALLRWGDKSARAWFERSKNPYLGELDEVARSVNRPGCYALNFSFEWLCTTGCSEGSQTGAPQMYRTLDWPFNVGGEVVVARHEGDAGGYFNIGWPGYVGVLTGLAPGRFAAAINQAPMSYALGRYSLGILPDWFVNRRRVARRKSLPPSHLLRHVLENCRDYAEAKEMLAHTPLCIPAIFTLSGVLAGESCVIERMEESVAVHEGDVAAANHWITPRFHGRERPWQSRNRRKRMLAFLASPDSFEGGWLATPVLNKHTCLVMEMNAGEGSLFVRGVHGGEVLTNDFRINHSGS
ncbi:MAG: linear amide C-N hydrolase [Hyphomicrobiales bacterium]|nr:linear amide C-N hydrolase [Hyphomicrobiales bacterium]